MQINQAWRPSEVYRCIETMNIWKKNGGGTSSLVHDSLKQCALALESTNSALNYLKK